MTGSPRAPHRQADGGILVGGRSALAGAAVLGQSGMVSRYPYVVYAWDGHSPYRLVMFPNESYRQVHTREELEVLAKEWGLDLDDPDQVVWEGGDRWPPPSQQ